MRFSNEITETRRRQPRRPGTDSHFNGCQRWHEEQKSRQPAERPLRFTASDQLGKQTSEQVFLGKSLPQVLAKSFCHR